VGLMGHIARAVTEEGGKVIGVIPEALVPREVSGKMHGDTRVVKDMHERKAAMADEAHAFISLPGGYTSTLPSLGAQPISCQGARPCLTSHRLTYYWAALCSLQAQSQRRTSAQASGSDLAPLPSSGWLRLTEGVKWQQSALRAQEAQTFALTARMRALALGLSCCI
jgi:hypothetical protein